MECKCVKELAAMNKRIETLELNQPGVVRLVELLESVESALHLFVKCGNALKWTITLGGTIAGAWYAVKHWGDGV